MLKRHVGTKPNTARRRSSERERQRHYQRAQSQEHHVIDHYYGEERYTQYNTLPIGTHSVIAPWTTWRKRATVGTLPRDGVGAHMGYPERLGDILDWSEPKKETAGKN